MKPSLTQAEVKELFDYRGGDLFWKARPRSDFKSDLAFKQWNPKHIGKKAGTFSNSHASVSINKHHYQLHRIIFLWHHGYLGEIIDHIDCNPKNNNIENLRIATHKQNIRNSGMYSHNKSGIKGVCWNTAKKKWMVQIKVNSKQTYIGLYDDIELADLVAQEARNKYHGHFANHGKGASNGI
jgi:hypothetical protein